jgi:hypothetical protein
MGRRGRTGEDNPCKDDSRQTRAALMGSLNGKHVPTDNPGKQKMASSLVSLGPTAKFCIGREVHFYRAPAAGRFEQSPRFLLGSRQAVVLTVHRATSTGPIGCIQVLAHHAVSPCSPQRASNASTSPNASECDSTGAVRKLKGTACWSGMDLTTPTASPAKVSRLLSGSCSFTSALCGPLADNRFHRQPITAQP